jgi:hypothetical protein
VAFFQESTNEETTDPFEDWLDPGTDFNGCGMRARTVAKLWQQAICRARTHQGSDNPVCTRRQLLMPPGQPARSAR